MPDFNKEQFAVDCLCVWEYFCTTEKAMDKFHIDGAYCRREFVIETLTPTINKAYDRVVANSVFDGSYDWEFIPEFMDLVPSTNISALEFENAVNALIVTYSVQSEPQPTNQPTNQPTSQDKTMTAEKVRDVVISAYGVEFHFVEINDPDEGTFFMQKTCVTQEQYEAVMDENPSSFKGKTNPVDSVSFHDFVAFCQKLNKQLPEDFRVYPPTEEEWTIAAYAGADQSQAYPWGDEVNPTRANYNNNVGTTVSVWSYPANAWGLLQVVGNVWEWCGTSDERKALLEEKQ